MGGGGGEGPYHRILRPKKTIETIESVLCMVSETDGIYRSDTQLIRYFMGRCFSAYT